MFPGCSNYRLYERGGAGICCDVDGVALGPMRLVERVDEGLRKRYRVCSAEVLLEALTTAYGPLPGEVMVYLAGGIRRVAVSLNDGNVPLAMIKAVQPGFPEIEADNLARMAACDMTKFNPWHDLLGLFTDAAHAAASKVIKDRNANKSDPTGGALYYNFRGSNSTESWDGYEHSTQIGPFHNSYPTDGVNGHINGRDKLPSSGVYVNTYYNRQVAKPSKRIPK